MLSQPLRRRQQQPRLLLKTKGTTDWDRITFGPSLPISATQNGHRRSLHGRELRPLKPSFRFFLLAGVLISATCESRAQASPTASRAGTAQIGAGWGFSRPDYAQRNIQGLTIYGSFDFTRHWGVAGDIHRHSMVTPADIGEDSYQIGPRYVFHHNRLAPYIKAQAGLGRFKYQYDNSSPATFTYGMFALGGGVDYRVSHHLNVRAVDFEYQRWPGFGNDGLSPLVFSFGAAYVLR